MAAKKKKAAPKVPKMTIKKAKKVSAPPVHPFKVRIGTRNQLSEEVKQYATEPSARQAIINAFNEWKPWCERYNKAGIDSIKDACERVSGVVFHNEPGLIECVFDEHTGMHVAVQYWTIR